MKILLVIYDIGTLTVFFPQGLAYIAATLKKEGYDISIYNQDIHHYPDEHLTEYLDNNKYDVIGVSTTGGYYQYRKLLKISDAINKSKNRPFYIIGGHGPAPEPKFFIRKTRADVVVIGEGELTIIELLEALGSNRPLSEIDGIAYKQDDKVIINKRRALIEDIDTIPFPAYEMFPIPYYALWRLPKASKNDLLMPVLSGRGCKFKCNFCYRMDKGFRPRSNESIIEEIKLLKRDYNITYINFSDELLMSSEQRTCELCEDIIKAELDIKWKCNGRLNYAKPNVLKLMKRAGCVFINYGIEAMDDQILKNMNKALTTKTIINGIEATLKQEITPGLNMLWGNIGESKATLEKAVNFLIKYGDGSQMRTIRPVTPYPGSGLYYYAIEQGLLKDCEDFYENKHLNSDLLSVNFTDLDDDDFHQCLLDANTKLIKDYFQKKMKSILDEARSLYLDKNTGFRGFRTI